MTEVTSNLLIFDLHAFSLALLQYGLPGLVPKLFFQGASRDVI